MSPFRSLCVNSLIAAAASLAAYAHAAPCRDVTGAYKAFETCVIDGVTFAKDAEVTLTQTGCSSVAFFATVTTPVAIPGAGPYDMCAIAAFNCSLYGDGCAYAQSPECRDRPPAPEPIVTELTYDVPVSKLARDFSGRVLTVGPCRVYR